MLGKGKWLPSVLRRMRQRFSQQVLLALYEHDRQLAVDTYMDAEALPSVDTMAELGAHDYLVNGPLPAAPSLTMCYRGTSVFVMKALTRHEARRLGEFHNTLGASPLHPNIISYDYKENSRRTKAYMIMPLLPATLESMPYLAMEAALTLWADMRDGLEYLHGMAFAHGDVKPANIGLSGTGHFVLIDLGSIARMEEDEARATKAYVPFDLFTSGRGMKSTASLDWWMLGMTLAEKACQQSRVEMGVGAREMTMQELRCHLSAPGQLPGSIWEEFSARVRV